MSISCLSNMNEFTITKPDFSGWESIGIDAARELFFEHFGADERRFSRFRSQGDVACKTKDGRVLHHHHVKQE